MMKKIVSVMVLLALTLLFVSCSKNDETVQKTDNKKETPVVKDESENKEQSDPALVLDIKPLENSDEEALLKAASGLGFENVHFFEAFANAIGVEPSQVTQEDIDKVHYIAVSNEIDGTNSVLVGYIDYVDLCFSDIEQSELMSRLNEVVMASEFKYDIEKDTLSDLAKFKNVEMFEIYDVKIDDVSFVKEYKNLAMGYFHSNGITDVSCLEGYNPASLIEIDFTGNDISDWSPLYPIKDKVIVMFDMQSGFVLMLDSYLEQVGNNAQEVTEEETKNETEDTSSENNEDSINNAGFVDKDGNPVDFSSLFD